MQRDVQRTWFSRRALALHGTALVVVPAFLALGWWQFNRATSGNDLSWAYTFEWPVFAAYAVFMWWKLVHEWPTEESESETQPPPGVGSALPARFRQQRSRQENGDVSHTGVTAPPRTGGDGGADKTDEDREDEELRAYNEYLADLNASDRKKTW